ncbi:Rib/alpha-like domain-containing protein, partial [Dermabacter sp. HSID17554]|uniref:Rib/alpha-like domain-containing protein n=1 Tax=Dermabacter sp. HSID17554 TaxID=2419511 RepID=UPI000F868DDC
QPAYTEVTVTQGDVAEVAAPVFTDEETGEERDMPEGTTFALKDGDIEGVWIDEETGEIKSSATHAAPATNVYEVEVTYPDGSKETVVATVKVVAPEQATLYQPVYAPAEVERGQVGTIEAPKFTDEETGEERDMPEGTKFALNDGEIEGVTIDPETGAITVETTYAAVENVYEVLVTYPDGSSEVVVATINVIDTPVDEPGEQPGEGTEQPGEGTEEPGEGTEEPGNGTEEPGEGTEEPGEGTEEPGEGTEEPGEGTEEPGEGTEEPGEGTEEPGDDAGEQPGDAGSDRPTKPVKVVPAKGGRHALPRTGAETGGLLAAAASLLAGGAALVTRRRKNEQ